MTIPPEARAAAFKAVGEAISGPGRLRKRQDIILVALEAAAPLLVEQGAAAERQRIRRLAIQHSAHFWTRCISLAGEPYDAEEPFADLLGGDR